MEYLDRTVADYVARGSLARVDVINGGKKGGNAARFERRTSNLKLITVAVLKLL